MQTEGAPKLSLGNSANASEIERLRAVIARESKIAVDLTNDLMVKCNYTFEHAWGQTKLFNKDVHARIADAHRQVQQLANAKPTPGGPGASPADYRLVETELKTFPESAFADDRAVDLLTPFTMGRIDNAAELQRAWAGHASELPASAYSTLLDLAAEKGSTLFAGDKVRAREAVVQRFPNIARAAAAGVTPKSDESMSKALGVAV